MLCERHLGLTKRDEELLEEDLTRMRGNATFRLHGYPL